MKIEVNIDPRINSLVEKEILREVTEMEKQPMANANAIKRFKRKIESLESANIPQEAMVELELSSMRNALCDIYASLPDIETEKLWEAIVNDDDFEHEDLTLCERYESDSIETIREELYVLFCGYKRHALEAIRLVAQISKTPLNVKRIFEVVSSDLSEDTLKLLYDQRADFVPVNYERDGHFFHKSNVEDFLDLESYDEAPSFQTLEELKKLFNSMVQTKSCVLYLRNNNEERNDVL